MLDIIEGITDLICWGNEKSPFCTFILVTLCLFLLGSFIYNAF